MRYLRGIFGKFWYLIVAGAMLAIFLTMATRHENLDVYTGGVSEYTVEKETDASKDFDSIAYVNNDISLSMKIPAGWQHVIKSGYDTYVHAASASSIQIQVISYYPMVNNVTMDSLYETYAERGYELTEFERTSPTSYYAIYKGNGMDGITDNIEYVLWDRSHVAKIVVVFNDSNYEKLQNEIWGCIDSIQWTREDPVSDGLYLYYSQFGDFEFAIPVDWATEIVDNTFYATLEGSNAFMTVDVLEDSTMMSNFSQIDYTNYLSSGRSNFALTQFQQDDSTIYAEATYYAGDVQMSLMQHYVSNGVYHYIITYECPTEIGETIIPLGRSALGMTRIFYTPSEEELAKAVSENETEKQDSVFTPDSVGSQMQSEIQSRGDNLMNKSGNDDVDYSDPTTAQDGGSVSSFAAALVQVAEIPEEKAEEISTIWNNLGMSLPTYAEAVKGNDEMLILLITDSSGTNYYLYVTRGGDLQEIHMNAEDGPTINFLNP